MKAGILVDPQDLELLRLAALHTGADLEATMSLALAWGCQRLREACPFPLPREAGGGHPGAPWAN